MIKSCKDCVPGSKRPLVPDVPGPRCATHTRIWRKRNKELSHARAVKNKYAISIEQYWKLYEAQDGLCFICRKAKGLSKMLSVEHEHGICDDHSPEKGCPKCIRALTCGRCNRLVAFLDADALLRAVELLTDPPARKLLNASS